MLPELFRRSAVPTMVDITDAMVDRAAQALMAQEAEDHLRDCYGQVSKARARRFARAALESALDLRRED